VGSDLRATLAHVFTRPSRIRRLIALGPFGWFATARFLRRIIPLAQHELDAIRLRAQTIPDPALREQALASIDAKDYHVEGGCILATFLPPANRPAYVRVIASLETIYDYLDNLCDRLPGVSALAFATLHEALLDALDDRRTPGDPYRNGPPGDDGGYLRALVDTVRRELHALPSYHAVRDRLVQVGGFYAELQTLKHGANADAAVACDAWYARNREAFPGLRWWEFAAACGSSLPVFALIELATHEHIDPVEIRALSDAYFPGISAVHIMLDYFIDQAEDAEHGELNFVACYGSRAAAASGLAGLVRTATMRLRTLAGAARHRFLVNAMCVFYLSHPKVFAQRLDRESVTVLDALRHTG